MPTLQDIIHKFEVGDGQRYVPIGAGILLFIAVLSIYNLREATGFASVEAMDTGQLAHNISQGEGFTTNFIRPINLGIYKKQHPNELDDPMRLKGAHPDLRHAPLYPYILAGAMKLLPFDFSIPRQAEKQFKRYQPEVLIGYLNQAFFIASAIILFFLTRRLFDDAVAWMVVAVFLGTDLLWRFAFSGLSTHLAILLTLALIVCLIKLESGHLTPTPHDEPDPNRKERSLFFYVGLAACCGLLLGALTLTRYSLGWLCLPTILYLAFYMSGRRLATIATVSIVMLLVISPWLWRNHQLSGRFFGTASYAAYHETTRFPDTELERQLDAEIGTISLQDSIRKFLRNTSRIAEDKLPNLAGSWLTALFLAGLLVPFSNKTLNRLRVFAVLALITLTVVEASSRSYLSDLSPTINTENQLVVLIPLVFIFGAGLFFLLLDQLDLSFVGANFYMTLLIVLLACLPLIFRLLPPRTSAIAYPPYSPPLIQKVGNWFQPDELMMSDMPWALGWYADQKCLWLTRNLDPDFFAINDQHKPINGLYLTPLTTDGRFLTQMLRKSNWAWGRLHMDIALRKNLPKGFPLLHVDDGFLPDQLILTDWPRWRVE